MGTLRDRVGPLHVALGSAMALAAGVLLFDYASRTVPAWYAGPSLDRLRAQAAERPGDARTLERLGMALSERERWVAAESAFAGAVAADSTSVTGFYMLGWVRMRDGRCDEALEAFRRTILLDVEHLDADHSLGFCLFRTGEWAQAEMVLRSVVERAPDNPGAHADLARVLLAQFRTDEAEAAFRRTLRLDPRNREARHGLAMVRMRRGDLDGARAALSLLVRDHPEAWLHGDLGHVAHLAGDHPAAAAAFAEAERLDPRYFDTEPYRKGMWKASREGRTFDPETGL